MPRIWGRGSNRDRRRISASSARSELRKKLLSVAENRRQAVYDLGQNLVDKIRISTSTYRMPGRSTRWSRSSRISRSRTSYRHSKRRKLLSRTADSDAEKAHTVFANLIDRISAHARMRISRRPGSRTQAGIRCRDRRCFRTGNAEPGRRRPQGSSALDCEDARKRGGEIRSPRIHAGNEGLHAEARSASMR